MKHWNLAALFLLVLCATAIAQTPTPLTAGVPVTANVATGGYQFYQITLTGQTKALQILVTGIGSADPDRMLFLANCGIQHFTSTRFPLTFFPTVYADLNQLPYKEATKHTYESISWGVLLLSFAPSWSFGRSFVSFRFVFFRFEQVMESFPFLKLPSALTLWLTSACMDIRVEISRSWLLLREVRCSVSVLVFHHPELFVAVIAGFAEIALLDGVPQYSSVFSGQVKDFTFSIPDKAEHHISINRVVTAGSFCSFFFFLALDSTSILYWTDCACRLCEDVRVGEGVP